MIFRKKYSCILLLIIFFVTGLNGQKDSDYTFSIGAKDLLKISVFNVPELNITVRVSEDGTITLPLLGNIKVEGFNRFELEKRLVSLLEKKYLRDPQVTVFIQEYQSKQVSVIGAVKKPGTYNLIGRKTLLELISKAGGLSGETVDRIVVIRQYTGGKSASLQVNLDELMIQGDPKLNIPLQAGDIINVPLQGFIDVYVLGQVKKPGQVKLKKFGQATLLKAIALAGGFTERARKSAVMVTRRVNGREVKTKLNVKRILSGKRSDFVLKNNDIVHVPESIL